MPDLKWVMFWPSTGFPQRPWSEHPDEDAFVRSARSVCELYSEAVRQAGLAARHSELRLACHHDADRTDVLVTVHPEFTQTFELAVVTVPSGIADLPAATRAGLVLQVVHGAATRLGRERGWDAGALDAAREHAVAAGLRYRWQSPAKSSPDRRHAARAVFRLYDDGYGRVVVQVRRRADDYLVAASAPVLAFSTSAGFARSASTLRWRSKTIVDMVPYAGLSAGRGKTMMWADNHGHVTVDLDTPHIDGSGDLTPAEHHDLTAMSGAPSVVVQTLADLGSRIDVFDVYPTPGVPDAYLNALTGLLQQLTTPPWTTWWSAAPDTVLEVQYDFGADDAGTTARRIRDTLRVIIRRSAYSFTTFDDRSALARQDVDGMLSVVRRRTGLGDHPPFT